MRVQLGNPQEGPALPWKRRVALRVGAVHPGQLSSPVASEDGSSGFYSGTAIWSSSDRRDLPCCLQRGTLGPRVFVSPPILGSSGSSLQLSLEGALINAGKTLGDGESFDGVIKSKQRNRARQG